MHTDDFSPTIDGTTSERFLRKLEGLGRRKQLSRRDFMALAGAVSTGAVVASQLGPMRTILGSGTAGGSADGIVVFVYLGGGNDGLNTVINLDPTQYAEYVRLRTKTVDGTVSSIAYPQPGAGRTDDALPGDDAIAFNPGLANISNWYRSGKVGVVQGIGYSNPSFSHFDSQDFWWAGAGNAGTFLLNPESGWLGRYGEVAAVSPLGLIALGNGTQPLAIRGLAANGIALSVWGGPRLGDANTFTGDRHVVSALNAMAGAQPAGSLAALWASTTSSATSLAPTVNRATQGAAPSGSSYLKRQMIMAANLVNADIGTRVVHCDQGGYDTHENQRKDSRGNDWHRNLLADLDDSLGTFFATLGTNQRKRVSVVVYSEFGRRPDMNATFGTDHGSASVAFVVGDNVQGGRYATYPSLFDLNDRNMRSTVDFRSLYATILQRWLGVSHETILGATHQMMPGLFAAAPGETVGLATTTTTTNATTTTTAASTTTTAATTTSTSTTTTSTSTIPVTTIATTTTTVAPSTTSTTIQNATSTTTTSVASSTSSTAPTTSTAVPATLATTTTTTTPTTPTTTTPTTTTSPTTTTTTSPTTTSPTTTSPTTTSPTTTSPAIATTAAPTTSTSTTQEPSTTTVATTTSVSPRRTAGPIPPPPAATPSPGSPDTPNVMPTPTPVYEAGAARPAPGVVVVQPDPPVTVNEQPTSTTASTTVPTTVPASSTTMPASTTIDRGPSTTTTVPAALGLTAQEVPRTKPTASQATTKKRTPKTTAKRRVTTRRVTTKKR